MLDLLKHMHTHRLDASLLPSIVLVISIAILWSLSSYGTLTFSGAVRGTAFNLLDYVVPCILGLRAARKDGIEFLVKVTAWPAVVVALLTWWEFTLQTPVVWGWFESLHSSPIATEVWHATSRASSLRAQATFGQPIFLGFYLAFAGILLFFLANRSSGAGRIGTGFAGAFVLVSSALPMARGSMIAVVVGGLAFLALSGSKPEWHTLVALAVIAVLFASGVSFLEQPYQFWNEFYQTVVGQAGYGVQTEQLSTWNGRLDMVTVGLDLIGNASLFGYSDVSVNGTWPILDVASVPIQVGLVSGIVGLVGLLILLVFVTWHLFRLWSQERDTSSRVVVATLVAVYLVVLLSWLDSSWPGQFTQIGWLMMGVIVGRSVHRQCALQRNATTGDSDASQCVSGSYLRNGYSR